ncbi:2-hydroxyacid dehydrogenase [Aureimonas populi]|uniref:2-hydroxyacid dehydrogenase n=1 Tax=Aureimonas populi TaxID=1701758 RepID=A0ABW5CK82_9HYPH|nr:2-hydroxyacid dehydrogenase [Aureimonas populi]
MPDLKTTTILVPGKLNPDTLETLEATFRVRRLPSRDPGELSEAERGEIRGIASAGPITAAMMQALPALEIVANFGVGYDGVDTAHAVANGITVTHTPDVLTDEVADTTIGLLLMTVRELPQADRYLRAGRWEAEGPYPLTATTLRGRSIGIMGLGRIGLAIAERLEPFGVSIAYHNRSRREDVPYAYHDSLIGLAGAVDTLIIAAPGGASTDKAVNGKVLEALGPEGVLINIGRGTTVDEPALIEALRAGAIRAAGLDVFEKEPSVPRALIEAPNTVLLPHVASASRHTRKAMGALVVENLTLWFSGAPLASPVPEAAEAGLTKRT